MGLCSTTKSSLQVKFHSFVRCVLRALSIASTGTDNANDLVQNPTSSYSVSGVQTVFDRSQSTRSSFPPNVRLSRHLMTTETALTGSKWAGSRGLRTTVPSTVTGVTPRYPARQLTPPDPFRSTLLMTHTLMRIDLACRIALLRL